ncbi:permease [Candidatus Scalindua japonica]|uniref:Permease n=1 Tax=Candidatus Scalindua japonica TaxID=1284222 RepID=A0A286TUB4_9BACT|nr:SO_0444 family Cu/Zn efflux transporter [Candidatus Scalindua japonica]GAX59482.1 permease [Candidatus Scalindua japonica]
MELIKLFLYGIWDIFLLLAPLMLIGLLIAGILHVLIPRRLIQRLMGGKGFISVITSAALGIPLPICSCGVVPIAVELNRKGASKPSTMSFLITTPESGSDSILITWGLLGPFMAIARPIASLFSALLAGIFAICLLRDNDENDRGKQEDAGKDTGCNDNCQIDNELNDVGISYFIKRIWSYAFKEMADEIVFSLLVGLLLAGLIIVAFPDNLAIYGLGKGIIPMLVMLAASVPLYMCASASTPIAAALIVKGISPGAAMVFLLAGPATNAATVIMLTRQFGGKFVRIYLVCIVTGALISGYVFDYILALSGVDIVPTISLGSHSVIGVFQWVSALLLIALMVWRFWNGAARTGLKDFRISG